MSREQIAVGNNHIDAESEFAMGLGEGYSYYYDTNRQLPRPFTSEVLTDFMAKNLHDPDESDAWNAGFALGWMCAFLEHDPAKFYTSLTIEEYLHRKKPLPAATTLQEA
jgi:hypothetical protein